MAGSDKNVLRVNAAEEETDFRKAVCEVIRRIITERDATLIDIAEKIDVSLKTISNAFNRNHSLCQTYLNRLGKAYGPHVLDPIAALYGGRTVPLVVEVERDVLPVLARANLKIVDARDPQSPGGTRETHREKADYLPDLRAVQRDVGALICQIEQELAA